MLGVALDGVILLLLLAAFGLGSVIWRGLTRLRQGDEALQRLIGGLDAATGRAEVALGDLRHTADVTGARLADDLARLQGLADDLRFLTDRGTQLADRLEEQIRRGRSGPSHTLAALPSPVDAGPKRRIGAADLERTLRTLR